MPVHVGFTVIEAKQSSMTRGIKQAITAEGDDGIRGLGALQTKWGVPPPSRLAPLRVPRRLKFVEGEGPAKKVRTKKAQQRNNVKKKEAGLGQETS